MNNEDNLTSKEMNNKEFIKKLEFFVDNYKSDKTKENKEQLEYYLIIFIDKIKQRVIEKDDSLIEPFIKANNVLPYTSRIALYALFDNHNDYGNSYYIDVELLPKPIWDYLPESSKKKIYSKSLHYKINPDDKHIDTILGRVTSKDYELRPVLTGMYFEDDAVTATDAHKLIHIAGKKYGEFKNGIYKGVKLLKKEYNSFIKGLKDTNNFDLQKYKDKFKIIDGNYPNWKYVLPKRSKETNSVDINLALLASICETLKNNVLIDKTTKKIILELKCDNEYSNDNGYMRVGFNSDYLVDISKSLMELGMINATLYFDSPSLAFIITNKKEYENNNLQDITFGLLMPIMILEDNNSNIKVLEENKVSVSIGNETKHKEITTKEMFGIKNKTLEIK